jgi:hypothetical protein
VVNDGQKSPVETIKGVVNTEFVNLFNSHLASC